MSYFSFCSTFLIGLLQNPFGNPLCLPVWEEGEQQTPLSGGCRCMWPEFLFLIYTQPKGTLAFVLGGRWAKELRSQGGDP